MLRGPSGIDSEALKQMDDVIHKRLHMGAFRIWLPGGLQHSHVAVAVAMGIVPLLSFLFLIEFVPVLEVVPHLSRIRLRSPDHYFSRGLPRLQYHIFLHLLLSCGLSGMTGHPTYFL